jgi:hypothetical protein
LFRLSLPWVEPHGYSHVVATRLQTKKRRILFWPKLKRFPFCPDEGGVFVFEDIVFGEAVPVIIFAVALSANVQQIHVVAGVAVEE